jgi:hypothetical protein
VISQNPSAGTSVNAGSAVSLVISTGPALVAIPNAVGDTQAAATTAITGAGLVVGTVTSQSSAGVASGNVISETPSAGTSVNAGSAVNLVVSTGPALPVSLFTSATISGSVADGYTVVITVANGGPGTGTDVTLTEATLDTTSGSPLPQSLGSLAGGASGTFTVNFPGSAVVVCELNSLTYSGTLSSGSFGGGIRDTHIFPPCG